MDRWTDERFKIGQTIWDRGAKEHVTITNGTCILSHSTVESFKDSHGSGGCLFEPSEGMVLRVVGVTHNGDPVIAYTYRKVTPGKHLEPGSGDPIHNPDVLLSRVRRSRKIGRI